MKRKSFLAALAAIPLLPFVKVEAAPEKIVVPPIEATGRIGNDFYQITPEDMRRTIEEAVNGVLNTMQSNAKFLTP